MCDRLVFCGECQRKRYRRKALTMTVEDAVGTPWREFRTAFEEAWSETTPLLIPGREWRLSMADNRLLVHVSIGKRRWMLLLHCSRWARGRKIAAERIVTDQAVARELFFHRRPENDGRLNGSLNGETGRYKIVCRMVAWLPRMGAPERPRKTLRSRKAKSNPRVRNQKIEEMAINILRKAIHANLISFPSQAPIFPSRGGRNLQRKVIDLYFGQGWSTAQIATLYELRRKRVQRILKAWTVRAVRAGYIQYTPPAL